MNFFYNKAKMFWCLQILMGQWFQGIVTGEIIRVQTFLPA